MDKIKKISVAIYLVYEFFVLIHLFKANIAFNERQNMVTLILEIIKEGLPILDKLVPDQATKIRNLILDYERKWDEENAKGANRDDALLDMYTRELHDIGQLFSAALKSAASAN